MAVNDEYITRLQQGDITEIPPGTVGRMQFLMELADLEMLTWKFGDASGTSDVRVLKIGIYDSMQTKYKYYYFNCDVSGNLTETQGISTSDTSMAVQVAKVGDESIVRVIPVAGGIGKDVRDVTTPLNVGGYVEYDYANPRFFIGGPYANSLYPNPYDLSYYASTLATEVYGLKVIGKTKMTWGDGIWYDINEYAMVNYGAIENQNVLKANKHQSWIVYGFKMRAGITKAMILANARNRQNPPFDPSYGEKYWKSLSDDKRFGSMLADIVRLMMQGAHSITWLPYYEDRNYSPSYVWDGGTGNFSFTESKGFETYLEAVAWSAQWDVIVDAGPLYHCSDIVEIDSYPFVEVLFNSTAVPFKEVGANCPWGILMIYNGALFYGGNDYVNANYNSTGTTVPLSPFLNDFFIGKDLTNATISFYESEEE